MHTAKGGPRYSATNSDELRYFTIKLLSVVNDLRLHDKLIKNIELYKTEHAIERVKLREIIKNVQ